MPRNIKMEINSNFVLIAMCFLLFKTGIAAPFCVSTNFTKNCIYYDAPACQLAARQQNGICTSNDTEVKKNGGIDASIYQQYQQTGPTISESYNEQLRQLNERQKNQSEIDANNSNTKLQREKFELEVKEKEIEFSNTYPDKPNPYTEYLENKQNERAYADEKAKNDDTETTVAIVGLAFIGILAIVAIAILM